MQSAAGRAVPEREAYAGAGAPAMHCAGGTPSARTPARPPCPAPNPTPLSHARVQHDTPLTRARATRHPSHTHARATRHPSYTLRVQRNAPNNANTRYIAALLLSLSAMLHLELPHVNVLSKVDLVPAYGRLGMGGSLTNETLQAGWHSCCGVEHHAPPANSPGNTRPIQINPMQQSQSNN